MKGRMTCKICGKKKFHSYKLTKLGIVLCPDCAWDVMKEVGRLYYTRGIRGDITK